VRLACPSQLKFDQVLHDASQEAVYEVCIMPLCTLWADGTVPLGRWTRFRIYNWDEFLLHYSLHFLHGCRITYLARGRAQACGRDAVENVLQGFNATVMAYGQTGAGKTYTMTGGKYSQASFQQVSRSQNIVHQTVCIRFPFALFSKGIIRSKQGSSMI